MRVHRRAVERQGQCIKKIRHTVAVDRGGVAVVRHDVSQMTCRRDLFSTSTPVHIELSMGRVPPTTLELSESSLRQGHYWVNPPKIPKRKIDCRIELGQSLLAAGPPVDFGYQYLSFNTYAITEWETAKASERDEREKHPRGRSVGLEFTSVTIRVPVERLVIRVQLPDYDVAPEPLVRVMRWGTHPNLPLAQNDRQFFAGDESNWVYDSDVSEHEGKNLSRVEENTWELCVEYPLVGHRYDVKWRIKDKREDERDDLMDLVRRGNAQGYRDILLNLSNMPSHRNAAEVWLGAMRAELLVPLYASPLRSVGSDIEVAIFAYDDSKQELRLVLECPPGVKEQPGPPLVVPLGEGVVGAALKRTAVVCYVDPALSGNRNDAAYLFDSAPEDEWGEPKWKFVIAFPLFGISDPLEAFGKGALADWPPFATVGVLTVSSTAPDSGLARLAVAVASARKTSNGQPDPADEQPPKAQAARDADRPVGVTVLAEATPLGVGRPESDRPAGAVEGFAGSPSEASGAPASGASQTTDEEPLTYDEIWSYLHVMFGILRDPAILADVSSDDDEKAQAVDLDRVSQPPSDTQPAE